MRLLLFDESFGLTVMYYLNIIIPLSIKPLERGARFEDPICDLFDTVGGTSDIIGSGSFGNRDGLSGVEIALRIDDLVILPLIVDILRSGGAPDKSTLEFVHDGIKKFLSEC